MKPILCSSNASLLVSKILNPNNLCPKISITLGEHNDGWNNQAYIDYVNKFGNTVIEKRASEFLVDKKNNIVTIPGLLKKDYSLVDLELSAKRATQSINTNITYKQ
jgi:hypothetical protein